MAMRFVEFSLLGSLLIVSLHFNLSFEAEDNKIQNGTIADIKDFPFVGRLSFAPNESPTTEKVCTAVLVASNTAITAGHCLIDDDEEPVEILQLSNFKGYLMMGVADYFSDDPNLPIQISRVRKLLIHKKALFDLPLPIDIQYDIGAVKVRMELTPTVALIPLIPEELHPEKVVWKIARSNTTCQIAGWGSLQKDDDPVQGPNVSSVLMFTKVQMLPKSICCLKYLGDVFRFCLELLGNATGLMCHTRVVPTSSTAPGDSGAPIVCTYKSHRYVVGVHTWSRPNVDPSQDGTTIVGNPGLHVMESIMREYIEEVTSARSEKVKLYEVVEWTMFFLTLVFS